MRGSRKVYPRAKYPMASEQVLDKTWTANPVVNREQMLGRVPLMAAFQG